MALPKIGWNEGSLMRRTLLHVGTFLLGSVAFIGLVSFVLVTIAKGIVSPRGAASDDEPEVVASAAPAAPRAVKAPNMKLPNRGKRSAAGAATAQPVKDE